MKKITEDIQEHKNLLTDLQQIIKSVSKKNGRAIRQKF